MKDIKNQNMELVGGRPWKKSRAIDVGLWQMEVITTTKEMSARKFHYSQSRRQHAALAIKTVWSHRQHIGSLESTAKPEYRHYEKKLARLLFDFGVIPGDVNATNDHC